jgi:hypothetical protein
VSFGNNRKLPASYRETGAVYSGVYLGIVRANADPQRMGRLAVWVSEFGPDTEEYWVTVSYATPFAGATPVDENVQDGALMSDTQKSYGWWGTPPDIDNQVLVCFLNGDMAKGFYFASIFAQNMNHMVPGIPFGKSTDPTEDAKFSPYGPPVAEYNKKTSGVSADVTSTTAQGTDTASVRRPVYTPLAQALLQQGLQADPERGPSNTSARRESPSRVFGMLTPRGNSIHVDDGYKATPTGEPENEFIRFRTRSGAQILIHETSGYIYMITKGGRSWVEISDAGIDMFSEGAISLGTQSDFNVTTGGSINFSAGEAVNIKAGSLTSFTKANTNFVTGQDFLVESGADTFFKANKNFGIEASKNVGIDSGADILMAACGVSSRNAKAILDNSGGGVPDPATRAQFVDGEVTTRVPRHEPFDHSSASTSAASGLGSNGQPVTSVVGADGSVSEVPAKVPASLVGRATVLYCKLKARGLKDVQIAGVLGVWQQESTLNSNAEEHGSAGQGVGLAQWSRDRLKGGGWGPGRKAKLFAYANSKGKSWKDTDLQLDFFMMELKGAESRAGNVLLNATTIDDAIHGMKLYERFGVAGKRVAYAKAFANDIKAGRYKC